MRGAFLAAIRWHCHRETVRHDVGAQFGAVVGGEPGGLEPQVVQQDQHQIRFRFCVRRSQTTGYVGFRRQGALDADQAVLDVTGVESDLRWRRPFAPGWSTWPDFLP